MRWIAVDDYGAMAEFAAEALFAALAEAAESRRRLNLGLATGNTMLGVYARLAQRLNRAAVDLGRLHTYNLDEYVADDGRAVTPAHPLSYRRYMAENLFDRLDRRLGFAPERAHFPAPADPQAFDAELAAAGGLDLQLLGLGFNGHIAFNEPMSEDEIDANAFAALPSRVVDLAPLTIATNRRLTAGGRDTVPRRAVTMGMRPILAARAVLLLACFPEQEAVLKRLRDGRATPTLPASYLGGHPDARIVHTRDTIASLDLEGAS